MALKRQDKKFVVHIHNEATCYIMYGVHQGCGLVQKHSHSISGFKYVVGFSLSYHSSLS